jgi:DNA-binding transcriptional regulator of glucitol operon
VNRWPAYLTSLALLLTTAAASVAILGWPQWSNFVLALLILALGASGAGYIIGTAASRGRRDPIAAPDPVETATSF